MTYWFTSTVTIALIETSRVASPADVVRILTTPLLSGSRFTQYGLFYRPVATISYATDYALWGVSPEGYHFTNVLLHGTAAVLAALAIKEVTGRPNVGALAAALFALHPLTAEVVPSVARRHDIIMTAFALASLALFVRSRRRESRSDLVGSVTAYALVLGAKEPALVFPGVVAAWVLLDGQDRSLRERTRESVIASIPFVAVTVAYLVTRIVVLGGVGGYERAGESTLADAGGLVLKYVLSLTYLSDVIGVWLAPAGWPLLVAVVVFLVPLVLLRRAGSSVAGRRTVDNLLIVATGAGLPAALLLSGGNSHVDWAVLTNLAFRRPLSAVVGATYVLGCLAGALGSVRVRQPLSPAVRASLVFFAIWLALPLGLFLRTGRYTVRGGYFSLVPAMAAIALLLVVGWRGTARNVNLESWQIVTRSAAGTVAANAALVVTIVLLLLPLLSTSPLVHPYDGWRMSGEMNEVTLRAIQDEVDAADTELETVRIGGCPTHVEAQRHLFPRSKSIDYLGPGTVEAWLRLQGAGNVTVIIEDRTALPMAPTVARTHATVDGTVLRVRIEFVYRSISFSVTDTASAGDAADTERTLVDLVPVDRQFDRRILPHAAAGLSVPSEAAGVSGPGRFIVSPTGLQPWPRSRAPSGPRARCSTRRSCSSVQQRWAS